MNILPTIIVRDITTLKSITSVFGLHIFFIFFVTNKEYLQNTIRVTRIAVLLKTITLKIK